MSYVSRHEHHLRALEKIVKNTGGQFEGNCFYWHLTFNMLKDVANKHLNIMDVAKESNKIVEIGFNAGHSALLMLIANPNCHIHAFDICSHKYVRPCVDYLNEQFGDRITLHPGDSHKTLQEFHKQIPDYRFDAIHIDGFHTYTHANIDFFVSKQMSQPGAICILDDTGIPHLQKLWDGYVRDGHIRHSSIRDSRPHNHSIGVYL